MWRSAGVTLLLAAVCVHAEGPPYEWEQQWGHWRNTELMPFEQWRVDMFPAPKPVKNRTEFVHKERADKLQDFSECIVQQAHDFTKQVLQYQSTDLAEVKQRTDALKKERGMSVTLSVFWGRGRYVRILWPYIERNLVANGGSVDKVILITKNRDHVAGATEARNILERNVAKYPGEVVEVEFCDRPYGCAYDKILNRNDTVYIKIDDDIVFIRDGSVEHLVLHTLSNPDYTFYTGAVVNNPHSYGVHQFAGAFPPTTFHWRNNGRLAAPFVDDNEIETKYWGKTIYDGPGSKAHESFIINSALGRLDMYNFGMWNMNECLCAKPQEGMGYCVHGYYRWSINAISWLHETSDKFGEPVPNFDEPFVSLGWPARIAPHRVGMVGEALFVHMQYTRQRSSKPDYGLHEGVLLPWYKELQEQYVKTKWGEWPGNHSLIEYHERLATAQGMRRFGKD